MIILPIDRKTTISTGHLTSPSNHRTRDCTDADHNLHPVSRNQRIK